jgi:hypothetical protein
VSTAGYSGTPLARKLGIVAGGRVLAIEAPAGYVAGLAPLPADVRFVEDVAPEVAVVHVFADRRAALATQLDRLRTRIAPDAAVWVSWPKKAAKVPTDITEDVIRELALPLGFVDVKVCAVSEVWSGLKLVIRKELRGQPARPR